MKWFCVISCWLILFVSNVSLFAQASGEVKLSYVQSKTILVTTNKTTTLVFPFQIKTVDRGSSEILVEKAKGIDNVLLLKGAKENFKETNLSVITADGKLYSFMVNYSAKPSAYGILISNQITTVDSASVSSKAIFSGGVIDIGELMRLCVAATTSPGNSFGIKTENGRVVMKITGIYVQDNVLFFRIVVRNYSDIDYSLEGLRFYLRDRNRVKRTAIQEEERFPITIFGKLDPIQAKNSQLFVVPIEKFTLPSQKYLAIEVNELNGGRKLQLKIKPKRLLHAAPLAP